MNHRDELPRGRKSPRGTVLTTVRDRVRTQKGAGRTLAAKPSAEFDAVWGKGMMPPDDFVALVDNTL